MEKANPNPGHGHTLRAAFSNAQAAWVEEVDLVKCLAAVLADEGHECSVEGEILIIRSCQLVLRPQFESFQPTHPKGAKVCSTIAFSHQQFGTARPFEYQHATGNSLADAFADGFKSWSRLDLPAILDALRPKPADCTTMEMIVQPTETKYAPRRRRAVLGPTAHMAQKDEVAVDSKHDFCPCCLLTNSFSAFDSLFKADALYGIRLFAMRGESGVAEADCRVNGEDFEEGRAALMKYAESWPDRGFEYRKQYVILQTIDAAANST